jgi:RNA polymerase sigma-70 factor (ECF subfamily)
MPNEQLLNGDVWVRQAVDHYEGPLLRYAARITGDVERARDAVQETFLRLCRQDRAELDGHLAQWLYTVCRNQALDVRRKETPMKAMSPAMAESCTSREPCQAAVLEQHETNHQILQLLDRLPANQQEVVRLKFQSGLSYREIAAVTSLSVSNVGYLIHTAVKALRTGLGESG